MRPACARASCFRAAGLSRRVEMMAMGHNPPAAALAHRLVRAPHLVDPDGARTRVAAMLATEKGATLVPLLEGVQPTRALVEAVADGSPYLWDLIERSPARLGALLAADPDARLRELLDAT